MSTGSDDDGDVDVLAARSELERAAKLDGRTEVLQELVRFLSRSPPAEARWRELAAWIRTNLDEVISECRLLAHDERPGNDLEALVEWLDPTASPSGDGAPNP